ncbi:UPF0236 family transposase-like protein [Anoxybacillus flavithermus]|uniref:UPF0236 family transposase-like protein n=1 Tax=Anoxybacillus flavithermus TaxID=33934 RepID=UPI0002D705ED|nr:UPF0236 family protein [Anoxybacillus flavithermus]
MEMEPHGLQRVENISGTGVLQLDRFHVAREIRQLFRGHARYRVIRKKLASWDEEGVLRDSQVPSVR